MKTLKVLLHVALTVLFSLFAFNYSLAQSTIEVSGDILNDTLWDADTVKVTGDITVLDDITLTIDPGTFVEFQGMFLLKIFGTILAEGEPGDSIIFSINDTTSFSDQDTNQGGWLGIVIDNSNYGAGGIMFNNDSSVFSHCIIEYIKKVIYTGDAYSNIEIRNFSKIKFEHCWVRNCAARVNVFELDFTSTRFKNNLFTQCMGPYILSLSNQTNGVISGNMICNNRGTAIHISTSSPIIINNIITNNTGERAGSLFFNKSFAQLINNTICNNEGINSDGGIVVFRAAPSFYNNIIYGNVETTGVPIYLDRLTQSPNFYNCLVEGGVTAFGGDPFNGDYIDNLDSNPLFVAPSGGPGNEYIGYLADWNLTDPSSCINSGLSDQSLPYITALDIRGNQRIKYGRVDLGAIEYNKAVINVGGNILTDSTWLCDTVKIVDNVNIVTTAKIQIPPGTIVESQGFYEIKVQGSLVATGTKDEMIRFTAHDTNYFSNPDSIETGWKGIYFHSYSGNNDSSILKYCIFEYGKNMANPRKYGGALNFNEYSKIAIDNCIVRFNMAANGGGIYIISSSFEIKDCSIHDNYSTYQGGGLYLSFSNARFVNCDIFNNHCPPRSGGLFLEGHPYEPKIINCLIYNNSGSIAGGIGCYTNAVLINNTLVNNHGAVSGGLRIYNCKPVIYNTIIWGNVNTNPLNIYQIDNSQGSPSLYNCNIQHGINGIRGMNEGIFQDIIESDPEFVNPANIAGIGIHNDSVAWSVINTSPCIDKGIMIPEIPGSDFLGNNRFNNQVVDIGAIENQGNLPQIIKQPVGDVLCDGDPVSLHVVAFDTVDFQWYKNGMALPGETHPEMFLNVVSLSDQGNYWCVVTNSYGSVTSNTATLFVNEYPEFLQEQGDIWAQQGKTVILKNYAKGSNPSFQWQKDGVEIPGEVTPELNITQVDYPDEGEYRCIIRNVCGADTISPADLYLVPQLCMVTFSTTSGDNLVVWEKQSSAPLEIYKIYREGRAAGIYDHLGTVNYSDLSVFVDTTSDPTVQAYLYKITGVDTSGFETDLDLCAPHKTIHLLVSTNPELNTTQLEWDRYYGFDYGTYIIYRSPTGVGYTPIHFMASSLHSWTDPGPLPDIGYYRIGVEKTDPCEPTGGGKKADSVPYSHAMSNTEDNRLQDQGNQPPDSVKLTNNSVFENLPVGSFVGRLETTDPDISDYHVYKLVAGDGDKDNYRFTTLGDLLITAEELDHETLDTCFIRVKTTDKGDLSFERAFVVTVYDVDETIPNVAPTDLTLSSNTINESMPAGSMVGRLWTEDPDMVDVHSYTLVAGEGSDDNDSFMVLGDMLLSDETFDYETKDTFRVRIQSADQGDLAVEKAITVVVMDVNESGSNLAPTAIELSANTIEENRPSGMLVGAFSTTDPDPGVDHAYTLVDGLDADDNDDFVIMGNILISGAEFDFETKDTLFIRVESTDEGDLSFEETFIILVTDVFESAPNLSPTNIFLTQDEIDENMPALTMIGRFQTDDPNMTDSHSYELFEGAGADDNNSFVIVGDVLFSTIIFDYETQTEYHLRIRSTDNGEGELTTEKSFIIQVNDLLEVGVKDLKGEADGLSIYPNPYSHSTMIEFSNPRLTKYQLYVTDVTGKHVYFEDNLYTDQAILKRNDLPAGVYFIELRGPKIYRGKIIVK